jgi:hypothetical protein
VHRCKTGMLPTDTALSYLPRMHFSSAGMGPSATRALTGMHRPRIRCRLDTRINMFAIARARGSDRIRPRRLDVPYLCNELAPCFMWIDSRSRKIDAAARMKCVSKTPGCAHRAWPRRGAHLTTAPTQNARANHGASPARDEPQAPRTGARSGAWSTRPVSKSRAIDFDAPLPLSMTGPDG